MKHKGKFKKTLSLILIIAMVLSMNVTVFADELPDASTEENADPAALSGDENGVEESDDQNVGENDGVQEEPAEVTEQSDETQSNEDSEGTKVAEVNGVSYDTLQRAVDSVSTSGAATITLLKDIVMTTSDIVTIPADKTIVLEMAGKSITTAADFVGRPIVNNGTLTVQGNGVIDSSASENGGYGSINNTGKLTIVNGTFRGATWASSSCIRNTGKDAELVIEDGTFEKATCAVYNEGVATINGGTFTGTTCSRCNNQIWSYTVRNVTADARLTINDGTVTGIQGAVAIAAGYGEINGGTFKTVACETHGTGATFYALYVAGEAAEVRCIVNNGTFETEGKYAAVLIGNDNTNGDGGINAKATSEIKGGTFKAPEGVPALKGAEKTGNPIVSGGTFTSEIDAKYCAAGFAVQKNSNGSYSVSPAEDTEAVIGSNGYTSLKAAIEAAADGDTVSLVKDIDITEAKIVIPEGKTLTLDLNGRTVKAANTDAGHILVKGGLVLKDSSDTKKDGSGTGKIYTESKYDKDTASRTLIQVGMSGGGTTISGTFKMESGLIEAALDEPVNNGQFGVGVFADSKVEITGGRINAGWYAISGNGSTTYSGAEIVVRGGILTSASDYAIYNPHKGKLTIYDGTIYGAAGGIAMRGGVLSVEGGLITSKGQGDTGTWGDGTGNLGNAAINLDGQYSSVTATISGGTILAEADAVTVAANPKNIISIQVSGGAFSSQVDENWCAPGYEPVAEPNNDGYYEVKKKPVAQITREETTTSYTELQDAFDAAQAGDTVVLVNNISLSDPVVIKTGKTLTLNLNGYKIDNSAEYAEPYLIANAGNLTISDNSETAGSIESTDIGYTLYSVAGNVTIDKGSVVGGTVAAICAESGTIRVNGGKVSGNRGLLGMSSEVELIINGGEIIGTNTGVQPQSGTRMTMTGGTVHAENNLAIFAYLSSVDISGGTISVDGAKSTAIEADGSTITISQLEGSTTTITGESGICLFNMTDTGTDLNSADATRSKLVMTGGTVTATDGFALTGNNLQSALCAAEITGGSLNATDSNTAIY